MIQHCFPELYTYLDKSIGTRKESQKWCLPYIDEYKKAKISNTISDELSALINEINNDEISFSTGIMTLKQQELYFKEEMTLMYIIG